MTSEYRFVYCFFFLQKKNAQGYQVTKQDPEELTAVCRVMEELIRMHDSVFTVSILLPCDIPRVLLYV